MTTFRESNILFQFDENWTIIQYDQHNYYKGLSGAGLKGVDFVGMYKDEKLLLMEVKNYRIVNEQRKEIPIKILLEQPEILVKTMTTKVVDSIRGIKAIHQYFSRKWLYRLLQPLLLRQNNQAGKWRFWARIHHLLQQPENVEILFWLEMSDAPAAWKSKIQQQLQDKLAAYATVVKVVDSDQVPYRESLRTLVIGW